MNLFDQIANLLHLKTMRPHNKIGPGRKTCLNGYSNNSGCTMARDDGIHLHLAERTRRRRQREALEAKP